MKTRLQSEVTKDDLVYTRIERKLVEKIDNLKNSKGFKNRSQTIRGILNWSYQNSIAKITPEPKKREHRFENDNLDEIIYTRIENSLLAKIDYTRTSSGYGNRSQTVRGVICWAFENGVENC